MAGPLTESEELELLELELEEAQAKARAKPKSSPFLRKGMDMVSAAQATPATGKQGALDRKNEQISVAQRVGKTIRQQQEDERAARVKPVEQAAGVAGRDVTLQGLDNTPAWAMGLGGPSATLMGNAASEQVYDDAGVMSASKALDVRGLNSVAMGIPALVNKDVREDVGQAGYDQPGAALAGDVAGYLVPGELGWQVGRGLYNATAKKAVNAFMPKGGSGVARATRTGQRYAEQVGGWAAQNAFFQGTVGESTAAAEEGRAPSLESGLERAKAGAEDPINVLGPAALIGLNRLREFASTGGRSATPKSVAEEIAARTAGKSGDGSVLDARMLGGDVDRRAETLLLRMLRDAGFSSDDVSRGFAAFEQAAKGEPDLPVLASRLKDVLIDKLGPRAEQVVQDFLQGAGISKGGTAGQAVASAVGEDYGRLSQFLEDSANARLGAGSRYDTLTDAQQEMSRIGKEGYERTFSTPAPDAAAVDDLRQTLDFFAGSELASPLRQVAAGKMLNVEQMVAKDPRRAAHWMQMAAGQKAQEAFDAGNKVLGNAYTDMRNQILSRLENPGVAPGYQQARMQFGDEFGIEQAVTFGSRFFTKVSDSVGVRQIADDLRNLTPDQQEAALLSIRDELLRIAGRHREGAAPRLTQVGNEQSLAGLETVVGEKGGQLANDIRFIEDRLARLRRIDAGANSRTASNQDARAFADRAVSNPVALTVGNALKAIGGDAILTSGTGSFTPIMMARGMANKVGESMARGRQGKIDDVTQLLLRDVGSSPRGPMPGDDMAPLTSRGGGSAPPNALASAETPVPPPQPDNALAGTNPYAERRIPGMPKVGLRKPPPAPTAAEQQASDEGLTNIYSTLGKGADTPESLAIDDLRTVERDLLAKLDDLENDVIEMGVDPAVLDDRRILPSDVSPNAWPRVQEIQQQMDDAATRLMKARDEMERLRNPSEPEVPSPWGPRPKDPTRKSGFSGSETATNAFAGAGLGAAAPADSNEDRARNMLIGAAGGVLTSRLPVRGMADDVVRTAGAGGKPRKPKADSPDAIRNALKDMSKARPKEPSRLERMVDEGKDAAVPPVNTMPHEADAAAAQAERMAARGERHTDIYDKTRVVFIPYNGANVPIVSPNKGPEEVIHLFYSWLREPPAKRPAWVKEILGKAPAKKGLLLTEANRTTGPKANAFAEQPLPKDGFPYGAVGIGAAAGAATGIPAGVLAGYALTRDKKPKNAFAENR